MTKWTVVGGSDKGGILVREGVELKSAELSDRLSTGAVIEELELRGERLHYKLLKGSGPLMGWVSLKIKGKDLVEPLADTTNGSDKADSTAWSSRLKAALDAEPIKTDIKAARPTVALVGKAPEKARVRLVIFNWTGNRGGAGAMNNFIQWPKLLKELCPSDTWEVCQVNLPGRGARQADASFTSSDQAATAVMDALAKAGTLPTVFFGFSFGAILAYETAALLAEKGTPPLGLVVASAEYPGWTDRKIGAGTGGAATKDMSDKDFEDMLHRKGGTEAILTDEMMKKMFLPVIRADMVMEEAYGAAPPEHPPLECPLLVFRGKESGKHCPEVKREDVDRWLEATSCRGASKVEELSSELQPNDQQPWLSDWYLCQGEKSSATIVKAIACSFGGGK